MSVETSMTVPTATTTSTLYNTLCSGHDTRYSLLRSTGRKTTETHIDIFRDRLGESG